MPLEPDDIENFGRSEALVVRAIDANGGQADTVELKELTGLNNQQLAYRYGKLEDAGAIETRLAEEEETPGRPTTVASLTDRGKELSTDPACKALAEEDEVATNQLTVRETEEEVSTLRQDLDDLSATVRDARSRQSEMTDALENAEASLDEVLGLIRHLIDLRTTIYETNEAFLGEDEACRNCGHTRASIPPLCPKCDHFVANHPAVRAVLDD